MVYFLKLYGCSLLAFLALDAVWLGLIARTFYVRQLGHLLSAHPNWWAAIAFYPLFVYGLVVFAIEPSLQSGSWLKAAQLGCLFGLITYATYDLTNQATLKDWPLIVTIVDLAWGAVLATLVSVAGYYAGLWLR